MVTKNKTDDPKKFNANNILHLWLCTSNFSGQAYS